MILRQIGFGDAYEELHEREEIKTMLAHDTSRYLLACWLLQHAMSGRLPNIGPYLLRAAINIDVDDYIQQIRATILRRAVTEVTAQQLIVY